MNSSDKNVEWDDFLQSRSGIVTRLFDAQQARAELSGEVPESWIDLVKSPNAKTIRRIWDQAFNSLARFTSYLSWAILDARIAESILGYALVYKLKSWNETVDYYENEEIAFEDGFVLAGTPIHADVISDFEQIFGVIPASLRDFWLTHGFIELRYQNFFASPDSKQQKIVGSPRLFTQMKDEYRYGSLLDCLAIANSNGPIISCISRESGTSDWKDHIVNVDLSTQKTFDSAKVHIDDMMSDWLFTEWKKK